MIHAQRHRAFAPQVSIRYVGSPLALLDRIGERLPYLFRRVPKFASKDQHRAAVLRLAFDGDQRAGIEIGRIHGFSLEISQGMA